MKKLLTLLSFVLVVAAASGCGSENDNNGNGGNPVINNPVVPNNPYMPGGQQCYYDPINPTVCQNCPVGTQLVGGFCQPMNGYQNQFGCGPGQFFNGWGCQNIGVINCPPPLAYNPYFGGCVYTGNQNFYGGYQGLRCNIRYYGGGLFHTWYCY